MGCEPFFLVPVIFSENKMEAEISTSAATLVGVILLTLERLIYYLVVLLQRKELRIQCNSCCGLCKGGMEMSDTERDETVGVELAVEDKETDVKEKEIVHS